ncbi:anti-sigma factor [Paraglaciecola Antarctic GD virus 1]|nr:anti-sigma factor [Paraglaciecola Antarctic GD virus 1]
MSRIELMLDIAATASILYKMGFDELVDNQSDFIRILNELGFTTTSGRSLNKMNYRMMISRLTITDRNRVVDALDMDIIHI